MASTRWVVEKPKDGAAAHVVRDRNSEEVIGGLLATPRRGGYIATRAESGEARHFDIRYDACSWLLAGFDAQHDSEPKPAEHKAPLYGYLHDRGYLLNTKHSVMTAIPVVVKDEKSTGPQVAQVICPSCKEPLEESDEDKYAPYHVSCRFGGLDT
jgi:hypothetical protein